MLVSVLAGDLEGRWLGPELQHGCPACLSFGSRRQEVKDRSSPGGSPCRLRQEDCFEFTIQPGIHSESADQLGLHGKTLSEKTKQKATEYVILVKYLPGMHEVLGIGPSTIGREKKESTWEMGKY